MSRTDKDKPYRLGGKRTQYWCSLGGHAEFTRQCRRRARLKAKAQLRKGIEPEPRYPVEEEYFD